MISLVTDVSCETPNQQVIVFFDKTVFFATDDVLGLTLTVEKINTMLKKVTRQLCGGDLYTALQITGVDQKSQCEALYKTTTKLCDEQSYTKSYYQCTGN